MAGEPTTTDRIPSAIASFARIEREIANKETAVFLDYDGTLTPIVERPELAVLSGEMRAKVSRLAALCRLAVISGRDLRDVKRLVGLDDICYAGSHGFDIEGLGGRRFTLPEGEEFLPLIDDLEAQLRRRLASIAGAEVERKKFSVAVHFRSVLEAQAMDVERVVDEEIARRPGLRKTYGKKVYDLQPDIDWHKGKALEHLLDVFKLSGPNVTALYLGDDLTDEDAFRAIRGHGIGIVVRDEPRPTWARYALESPAEAGRFLDALAEALATRRS